MRHGLVKELKFGLATIQYSDLIYRFFGDLMLSGRTFGRLFDNSENLQSHKV